MNDSAVAKRGDSSTPEGPRIQLKDLFELGSVMPFHLAQEQSTSVSERTDVIYAKVSNE